MYPMCTLVSILSPGKYVVVSTEQGHVSEVKNLEKLMKQGMDFEEPSDFDLRPQRCVAVMDSKGALLRGVIEAELADDLYEVLLIDYGQIVHITKSDIKVTKQKQIMSVEPLAFLVVLYGLIPVTYDSDDVNTIPRACEEWLPESLTFVENFFKYNKKVIVKSILNKDRTVYGDLYLRPSPAMKFVPLRKMLCKNKFCIYSETNFLKLGEFDPIFDSPGVEFVKSMERVKKWQQDCIPYQKVGRFHFPIPGHLLEENSPGLQCKMTGSSPKPVSQLSSEESEELGVKEPILGGSPSTVDIAERPRSKGRGKLSLPVVETVKSQVLGVEVKAKGCQTAEELPKTRVTRGRGMLLQSYWKAINAASNVDQEKSTTMSPSGLTNFERCGRDTSSKSEKSSSCNIQSEINVSRRSSRMERAVIKKGDDSKFNDSNQMTERSLSPEERPPLLVQHSMIEKKESSASNIPNCSDEVNKTEESLNLGLETFSLIRKRTLSCSNESNNGLTTVQSVDRWPLDKNIQELPSGLLTLSNTWNPYVLFDDTFVEPVNTFAELQIQSSIIKNLEKAGSLKYLSQIQRWAIPTIRKQQNTVAIGSSRTGKTSSYIVPIIDYVLDESNFEELPPGNGPTVVIVASGSRVCEDVYYMCHSLLGNCLRKGMKSSPVRVVLAHGGGCEEEVWVSLTNGCDILISTPPCLVRLLEMPVVTNFERLTCLVLDEVDVISQYPFQKSLQVILKKADISTRGRLCQKILCGERLTSDVNEIIKSHVKSCALIITSYSEAVIYERLKPSIFLVDRNRKLETLAEKLENKMKKSKILIVCELTATAIAVGKFLSDLGTSALLAHEHLSADRLRDVRRCWQSSTNAVMVANDGILNELNINDVQILVHYDLPNISKTNFYLRYSTLKNFLQIKRTFSETQERLGSSKVEDIILVDDENHYQLPHIIEFVMRLGGKVPQNILQKCEEIRRHVEVSKRDSPICGKLLSFGRCQRSKTCPRRHVFVKEWDCGGSLPNSGWVNFVVLRSHDATCFSARLMEHVDAEGKTSRLEGGYLESLAKLSQYFRDKDNRRVVGSPKTGDVCAVWKTVDRQEVFHRAKVIEYLKVDKHHNPLEVAVKLLDQGDVWRRKVMELYELPDELSKLPPAAVDVILVGLQPLDFDDNWSEVANNVSASIMTEKLEKNQFWSGRIAFALNCTLFLDTIRRKEFLPQLNTHVHDLIVERELIKNRIAVANDEHLPTLLKLCGEAGIDISETVQKEEKSTALQPQWAFLERQFIQVKFLAAESTSIVFLQQTKFEKALQELEEDCQKEGERSVEMRSREGGREDASALSLGTFCLALFEDGKWNRGRIESENKNDFHVFFVDHGDFLLVPKSDVVPIPETLLLRLPCQAIECRLVGIEDQEECPLEVLKEIYSFSEDGEARLYASVVSGGLKPTFTKGQKYSLNLVDVKGTSLSKMLVDREFVRALETEKEHLKNADLGAEGRDEEEESESSELNDSTANYFLNLGDDVFKGENGQSFLLEFASRIFSATPKETPPDAKEECVSSNGAIQDLLPVRSAQPPDEKAQIKTRKKFHLKNRENVLTPQVLWHQTQAQIHLKILLEGVQDCNLECTVNNVSFRCLIGEKFYVMDLRLYGAINPSLTRVAIEALYVTVVLTKLAFPLWPRLPEDEGKVGWISLNVEGHYRAEGAFSKRIRIAKLEIESGMVKKGRRDSDCFLCSDSEDADATDGCSTEDDPD